MKREIKFRGLRIDCKGWVYGDLLQFHYENKFYILQFYGIESGDSLFNEVSVIPESVGQFTGLQDKNGVDIYEGDYIGMYGSKDKIEYWEYSEDGRLVKVNKYGNFTIDSLLIHDTKLLEVIGNIHENK